MSDTSVPDAKVRQMWHLLEPLHAVLYYAPEAFEEAAALGYEVGERWPSYFAWRAAPLGAPGATRVASAFYSFNPAMVAQHVPAAWQVASPDAVLAARLRGVDRAYRALFGDVLDGPEMSRAADLARRAAEAVHVEGRPLAAANAELPWPDAPHLVLWQAATVLREHRGDGHVAALLTAGLGPADSLVSFAAIGAAPLETFASRGWTRNQWDASHQLLAGRGLLDDDGIATDAGRALRAEVETMTDRLATGPWRSLGADATAELAELLGPLWVGVLGSGLLPSVTTLGIGKV
ncbi:SCO6745 family protein [Streptomyces longispororuber]|uniref:SCO6745 family protein n=1 Tax=Streptomyces longispororuber TaxID=68230 RepID=UPI00210B349B|nr:hypothetical protein [Streptomyces longispororuber]MCQ4212693.1 hypothetical protein [Streptomyces longispororuber]